MVFNNYLSRNNIRGYLDAWLSASATTMIIQVSYESIFPEPTVDRKYLLTLERLDDDGNVSKREIVKVISKSVNTFTIERSAGFCLASYDATTYTNTPFAFFPWDIVSLYVVSEDLQDVKDELVRTADDITDVRVNGTDRLKVIEAISWTPLRVDIGAWNCLVWSAIVTYAGSVDNVVTDSATNYVMIDNTGTIQISTIGWNGLYTRLAVVICAWWAVTSIFDWRTDTVGWPVGSLDIDWLTEKETIEIWDEFIVWDSSDSFLNKKAYSPAVRNRTKPFCAVNTYVHYTDNLYFQCWVGSSNLINLYDRSWQLAYKNNVSQFISSTTILAASTCVSSIIHSWRIYACIRLAGDSYVYSCDITDNIASSWNWSLDFTIIWMDLSVIWFDGSYLCFVQNLVNKIVYRYDTLWVAGSSLTFASLPWNIARSSKAYNWKYLLSQSWPTAWYLRDSSDTDLNPNLGPLFSWTSGESFFVVAKDVLYQQSATQTLSTQFTFS